MLVFYYLIPDTPAETLESEHLKMKCHLELCDVML